VDDDIGFRGQPIEDDLVTETGTSKVKLRVTELMLDVSQATGGEVVKTEDAVSARQQRVDEMGADKPGSPSDEPGGRYVIA